MKCRLVSYCLFLFFFHHRNSSWDQSIKLWDPMRRESVRTFKEHRYCVYSCAWSPTNPDSFASAAGDYTVKLWDLRGRYMCALCVLRLMMCCDVMCACGVSTCLLHPRHNIIFISYIINPPHTIPTGRQSSLTIRAHDNEVLTCDWNKYNEFTIVSGSVDKTVKIWVRRREGEKGKKERGGRERRERGDEETEKNQNTPTNLLSLLL